MTNYPKLYRSNMFISPNYLKDVLPMHRIQNENLHVFQCVVFFPTFGFSLRILNLWAYHFNQL